MQHTLTPWQPQLQSLIVDPISARNNIRYGSTTLLLQKTCVVVPTSDDASAGGSLLGCAVGADAPSKGLCSKAFKWHAWTGLLAIPQMHLAKKSRDFEMRPCDQS